MRLGNILMEKKDVSDVSFAKQFVRHLQSLLIPKSEMITLEGQLNMRLICLNVYIADFVKKHVQ